MVSFQIFSFILYHFIFLSNSVISTIVNIYLKKSKLENSDVCKSKFKTFGYYWIKDIVSSVRDCAHVKTDFRRFHMWK
jgi:hypothetical protein